MEIENNEAFAAQLEFTQAFYSVSTLLCGYLVGAEFAVRDDMVERLQGLAASAGNELAKITGRAAEPNRHLVEIANGVQCIGAPFKVIDGGGDDDSPSAA